MKSRVSTLALAAISCVAFSGQALAQGSGSVTPQVVGAKPGQARPNLATQLDQIEDVGTLLKLVAQMRQRGDAEAEIEAWSRLVELRPHIGRYRFELAARYALLDQKSNAYNALLELQSQGYNFDAREDKRFEKVATTKVWEHVLQGFDTNRTPFGEGKIAYTLPKEDLLLESLAWDASRKQLLVGSARDGAVYRVDKAGKLTPLVKADAENGLWAVFDLVVDDKRGVLWVASTAMPHFRNYNAETDLGRAGIFKFDLKTGKFLKKFLSPTIAGQNYILSSIALGDDGAVYAADGVNNAIYQVRDDQFSRILHAPTLTSIRGIAVGAGGKSLYIGDHERGLVGLDLATGKPFDVRVPKNLSLGLIEGVSWWKGNLLIVQNGLPPSRIMRLDMSDDGKTIEQAQPLAANDVNLAAPTLGTVAGDTYYVIANSQKDNYDRFGLLKDKGRLQATKVYAVDAGFAPPAQPEIPVPPSLRRRDP